MFQYLAAFRKKVCVPFPLHPWHFIDPFGHLDRLIALSTLLILADLYISTMGGWHWCCIGVWISCNLDFFCIVGVIKVIGCGGQFSCYAQLVFEMLFHRFHGTFKCVAMQFVSGAPLAFCDDHCRAQLCIGAPILTLFFVVLIFKHSGMSSMNLCFLYENQNLDNVQVHRFIAFHFKQQVHKIQQSWPNQMWCQLWMCKQSKCISRCDMSEEKDIYN